MKIDYAWHEVDVVTGETFTTKCDCSDVLARRRELVREAFLNGKKSGLKFSGELGTTSLEISR